ncbi:MAG: YncE family protein [Cyanobacteria bacterium REEB65]|nr:YncE family protein [Cyanobacteria bacterium REEB65]
MPLRVVADVSLPGRASRLDYQSLDRVRHLLFVSHMGDSSLLVFDATARRAVKVIPDIGTPTGVLAVPDIQRVFVSATRTDQVVELDEETLAEIRRYPAAGFPDGIAYDPADARLFVSNESGGRESVIDVTHSREIATLNLGGQAGNSQYNPVDGLIYVAVQTRDELIAIDPSSLRIVARYLLPGADGDHGVNIDARDHLAFIACEGNDRLLVFDLDRKRVVERFAVGGDPDVLALDPALGRLYVASESGIVTAFTVHDKTVAKIGEGYVGPDAHTVSVDPATHLVYFPLGNVLGRPVIRIMAPPST